MMGMGWASGALVGFYAALCWPVLLEKRAVVVALALVAAAAFTLRIVAPHAYPWGLHEDEYAIAHQAASNWCVGRFTESSVFGLPVIWYTLTTGPLTAVMSDWSLLIRLPAAAAFAMSVPLLFCVARLVGLSPVGALMSAAVLAVSPWAILLGRVAVGAETVLNGIVVLYGLVLLCDGTWPAGCVLGATIAGIGCWLCLEGYGLGKTFVAIVPIGAFVGAETQTWRRRLVLACTASALAVAAYTTYAPIHGGPWYGAPTTGSPPVLTLERLTQWWRPLLEVNSGVGSAGAVSTALMYPWLVVLVGAFGGIALTWRTSSALLVSVCLVGLLPYALGHNGFVSRRASIPLLVLALWLGAAVDEVSSERLRAAVACVGIGALAWWGVPWFFSEGFWGANKGAFCAVDCRLPQGQAPERARVLLEPRKVGCP